MKRLVLFFLGIFLSSLGLAFFIMYLNLFNLGYSFIDFVKFIIVRVECYFFPVGIFLIRKSIERKKI